MARDYASKSGGSRRRRGSRRRHAPPAWAWLVAGLFIGLFVAFLFYLSKQPTAHITLKPEEVLPAAKPLTSRQHDTRDVRKSTTQAPPGPDKSASKDKPRFDFYTILPDMEVQVPDQELDKPATANSKPALDKHATYVLQVGAFRSRAEAESLKAKLALNQGIQAEVQSVTIGEQTWHRVRLGPYHNLAELNAARDRLKRDKVPSIVLKIKG